MEANSQLAHMPATKAKREVKYDSGVGSQQFLKGGNTVSLVSSLVDHTVRNKNSMEVYERFKFLSKEWFRTQGKEIFLFKMVLNEVDLYLKSYDEDEEDSGWDSDQEVGVVSVGKNLKSAIEEKLDLFEQLSKVECDLVESNMSSKIQERSSVPSSEKNLQTGDPLKNKNNDSFNTEETSNTKEDNSAEKHESNQNNLYKNVLKKVNTELGGNKEPLTPSVPLISFDSDTTIGQKDDDWDTPKVTKKKTGYKSRMSERVHSSTFYAPRSSSIQSIRSNKSNMTHKKSKKSSTKKSRPMKILPKRKISISSDSESDSWTSSASSVIMISPVKPTPKDGGAETKPKPSKGLSSFAKKKEMIK